MIGSWDINVTTSQMPQKVAYAMDNLELVGVEYNFIAYLGSQITNGTNHAVLAEQTVLTGHDSKNIVILIFNEKGNDIILTSIDRVLETGGPLGGMNIDIQTTIPQDALDALNSVLNNFVGSVITPISLLATKVTTGTNYIFAIQLIPFTGNPQKRVGLLMINSMTKQVAFTDLLTNKLSTALGYAFTW
jgi:hypothetical protein